MPQDARLIIAGPALYRYGLSDLGPGLLASDAEIGMHAAREAALRINAVKRAENEPLIGAGLVRALFSLARAATELLSQYVIACDTGFLDKVRIALDTELDDMPRSRLLSRLGTSVIASPEETSSTTGGVEPRLLEDTGTLALLVLGLLNRNPALADVRDLIVEDTLEDDDPLTHAWKTLSVLLDRSPGFDPGRDSLGALLTRPQRQAPDDPAAQLAIAHEAWSPWLAESGDALLLAAGELREEHRPRFEGPGPAAEMRFEETNHTGDETRGDDDPEAERYSPDRDWMPRLVLLAKNTHVWLSQLSRRYGRPIVTLDAVPDEVLDEMAMRGITGLWLIGVWQRSRASREIKRRHGNAEALASAYAVTSYRVADDLGGETALDDLRRRAAERGVRLAGDMVPNHTGLDSDWVHDHPDWFVGVDQAPYPSYGFSGDDLSDHDSVAIRLEDGYADHSDAAVVFQRTDANTGTNRYIYHGNDGTNMPWNDTAQIDFLNPEAREGVIQEVVAVARRFPVIRFDAAMVLAQRHVRRLWHPEPGAGSDIPGRAAHALDQRDFDRAMPREFWREVVDRIAVEAPDTLLLAEAFWLMEGYFVRTLGMHRVYNSAFMHMIRDRDNATYRKSIKNVLEFAPAILQRMVNFLSNPDEATAESQFGKGDPYFGACTLLATLPGLPMIAHGQFEGYTEKYGMEYARDYADESPDMGFVAHHEHMIQPLLRDRALFAGAERFRLFDVVDEDGTVAEDVFCYVNGLDDRRVLVLFNNSDFPRAGRAHVSAAWRDATEDRLRQETLADALGVADPDGVWRFRDPRTDATQEAPAAEIRDRGLWVSLEPFECRVYLDPGI
jgi:glycosidase